jgi:hypothetical protein
MLCPGCHKWGFHSEAQCWVLHPELRAGAKSVAEKDEKEVPKAWKAQAKVAGASSRRQTEGKVDFELDCAASDHFVNSLTGVGSFDSSTTMNVELADSRVTRTEGAGTFVNGKLPVVNLISSFGSNLMSAAKLLDTGKSVILSPSGSYIIHSGLTVKPNSSWTAVERVGNSFIVALSLTPTAEIGKESVRNGVVSNDVIGLLSLSNSQPQSAAGVNTEVNTITQSTSKKITSELTQNKIYKLHLAFGCPCDSQLYEAIKHGHLINHQIPVAELSLADIALSTAQCQHCAITKSNAVPHPAHELGYKRSEVMYTHLYADTAGPIEIESYGGNKYSHVIVDDATREGAVFISKTKSQLLNALKTYEGQIVRASGSKIRKMHITNTLRTDNGGENVNAAMTEFCNKAGIKQEFTSPHSSASNSIAERRIGIYRR